MAASGEAIASSRLTDMGDYHHGVQVIDEDKEFNPHLQDYLDLAKVTHAGFNYHLISVFGSQSTGKSTLLNHLFGTSFGVMSEDQRRQTTRGIWLSKNLREHADGGASKMAENILVMDVEGTDGRERGEDQDFERKSALFALATSEVLIINIWEHQVGLYQGANMALLKTVFEVNLQLFLRERENAPRSLLFFVIRDHLGSTPLANLRNTLMQDLSKIWASLSKPAGLEKSEIGDYFDFAFFPLPHKILQPDRFSQEVAKLGLRFRDGFRSRDSKSGNVTDAVFLPEYHRRIPADGFAMYASGVWDQINSNKDLDLPTQQELLAQYRCDEIAREALVKFDEAIQPLEDEQSKATLSGSTVLLRDLGSITQQARDLVLKEFESQASRYHKGVYRRKRDELQGKVDMRLKALFQAQLGAAHKLGIKSFSDAVSEAVRQGQKKGANYDFAQIVSAEKEKALSTFQGVADAAAVEAAPWSDYQQELSLYRKDLEVVSARLRKDEMRRLAARIERWVKSRLAETIGLEFNALGSGREAHGPSPEVEKIKSEKDLWTRVWESFTDIIKQAELRFSERAKGFDASPEEVEVGLWRLRRKSWTALRARLDEEVMEGNILLKLRENFEDKFRYDTAGVPRIWRPTDDIESIYTAARASTLKLIPLLSRFRLSQTSSPPPLDRWIGHQPASVTAADEEDLQPIGGIDEEDGKTLEDETLILSDAKAADLTTRFKKTADGVYVEAKRSAIGGITQVPLYFYGLLLALGWNELVAVLRNPLYFVFLILMAVGFYVTYTLNLWTPIMRMADAASRQAVEVGKERLREFLEASERSQGQSVAINASGGKIRLRSVNGVSDDTKVDHIDDI